MVPVLNSIGTHCAVFGNHDFGKFDLLSSFKIIGSAISGHFNGI